MRNNTRPVNDSNQKIIAQLKPMCPACGGYYSVNSGMCLQCGCKSFVKVWEYDAADVRAMIAGCNEAAALQLGGAGVLGVCGMAERRGIPVNYGKRTPDKWYEDIK